MLGERRLGLSEPRRGLTDRRPGLTDRRSGLADLRGLADRRGLIERRGLSDLRGLLESRRDGLRERLSSLGWERRGLLLRGDPPPFRGLGDRLGYLDLGLTDRDALREYLLGLRLGE